MRLVLTKLCEFDIQVDIDKCKFHVTETKYLGLIVSTEGIRMDLAKIEATKQWDTLTYVQEVCLFVGFCNFYRRFIKNFSKIAGSLNLLTRSNIQFAWTVNYKKAFQELKQYVCKDPILCHFDLSKQCFVETDSLDYVNAGVLSQIGEDGLLHLIAYFSRRITPAECNYKIYDKELLAIIWCFKEWRPELENTGLPVKVLTNHKGLEYFMTIKKLIFWQVRWAEFLSEFNFVISYQSGKKNNKADALMKKLNEQFTDNEDKRRKHSIRVLLPPNWIDHEAELQPIEENHGKVWANFETVSDANEETSTLPERVMESNWNNKLCNKIHSYLANPKGLAKPEVYLKSLRVKDRLLMKRHRL